MWSTRFGSAIRLACVLALVVFLAACDNLTDKTTTTGPEMTGGTPQTVSKSLSLTYVQQQTPEWCWAAASQMVLQYYNVSVQQCGILQRWTALPCCVLPLTACVQGAPSIAFIQQTLFEAGGLTSFAGGPLTAEQARAEIDAGRPFIIAYQGSFSGHVVVVSGYISNADGSNLRLNIDDPYYGYYTDIPFALTFTYGQQMNWAQTVFGIHR